MAERPKGSAIRAVLDRATELELEGRSIVHLEIGRPHADTPIVIREAAETAMSRGQTKYTASRGTPQLRSAIQTYLGRRNLDYDPETEICVTAGGSEAVFAALAGLLSPGDGVAFFEPAWPHYAPQMRLVGLEPQPLSCSVDAGFQPDPEMLAASIGKSTRALIISSPNNPSGAVIAHERLEALAALAQERDLIVISDEIYERFVYDDAKHVSIATLPGMRERTVVCHSFSKSWAMTGWRVGWTAAPAELSAPMTAVHQYVAVCAPSFAQAGATAALEDCPGWPDQLAAEYGERRRELLAALARTPALELKPPEGAFYAFPRMRDGSDATKATRSLLEDAGVAVVPGAAFGDRYASHLRISYAVSEEKLREGLERVERFFDGG